MTIESYEVFGRALDKQVLSVLYVDEHLPLDFDDEFWTSIEPVDIHLYPQSARAPHGNEERMISVRAAYNQDEIAFSLAYSDETENRAGPAKPDACAVLIAPEDVPATAQMMGFGATANVWQWMANLDTQQHILNNPNANAVRELIAHGPGTQKPMPGQNVEAKGFYADRQWRVVFKRKLKSAQEGEIAVVPGERLNIAFALWNGEKEEAFSRKSIAIMRVLDIEERR